MRLMFLVTLIYLEKLNCTFMDSSFLVKFMTKHVAFTSTANSLYLLVITHPVAHFRLFSSATI